MTRFGLTVAVLAAGVLLWSSNANANAITITGGLFGSTASVLATGSSMVNLPTTTIGSFSVGGLAIGTPASAPGTFLTDTIAVKASSGTGQILILSFTEQGLTSIIPNVEFTSGLTSNFIASGWNATLSTFLDPTNRVAPPNGSEALGAGFFTTGPSMSVAKTTVPIGSGPFSLQEVYRIQSPSGPSGGSANLTIDIMGVLTPEPATLALLGTGLVAIGGVVRRRR